DSTINRGGIRMGTSELYRVVLGHEDVLDALVVDADGFMPLFVVLRDGARLDDELRDELCRRIREDCSPRHVPNEAAHVAEIPRPPRAKTPGGLARRFRPGPAPEPAGSRDSLQNPRALDWFVEWSRARASA